MTSIKVDVNGWPVWCEKFGSGPKALLMIPGGIGTGRTDFYHQVIGEDSLDLEKLTIICVELPGWGRSHPPNRPYGPNVYKNDAECCLKLMQSLGYEKFSVLGWSDGSRSALILTSLYPNNVESLILFGIVEKDFDKTNIKAFNLTNDVNKWHKNIVNNYLRSYKDQDQIQQLWTELMTFVLKMHEYFPNGVLQDYDSIKCPVLIIQGDCDRLIDLEHALYVKSKLKQAQIIRFPFGSHYLHQKYRSEFKTVVEDFIFN